MKTVRLEDQDLPHDVLQDPRLAATRSRLNQRLQHLLDEVPDAGKLAAAEEVDVEHARVSQSTCARGQQGFVVMSATLNIGVLVWRSLSHRARPLPWWSRTSWTCP